VAARLVLGATQVGFDGSPVVQQRLGMGVAALTVFGELHGVRRALQQAQAQQFFEPLQPAADGGLGAAELGSRGREAAGLDDAHEGVHQREAVHARRGGVVHACHV
jgi:hypothetical protein